MLGALLISLSLLGVGVTLVLLRVAARGTKKREGLLGEATADLDRRGLRLLAGGTAFISAMVLLVGVVLAMGSTSRSAPTLTHEVVVNVKVALVKEVEPGLCDVEYSFGVGTRTYREHSGASESFCLLSRASTGLQAVYPAGSPEEAVLRGY